MAPENPGALEVIAALASRGVVVSTGHSMATYDEAVAGFDAGARYGTHLFNAMPPLGHRDPGLPGALLADDRMTVGFIADGVHTHRSIIALVWRMLGPRRMSLVTDAMAALGMPPGSHRLGDYDVIVDATSCRLADGTLAGSILELDQALRNLLDITGCSLDEALETMTTTPAKLLGLEGERGRIAPGYTADIVLLSSDLRVQTTIASGEVVYRRLNGDQAPTAHWRRATEKWGLTPFNVYEVEVGGDLELVLRQRRGQPLPLGGRPDGLPVVLRAHLDRHRETTGMSAFPAVGHRAAELGEPQLERGNRGVPRILVEDRRQNPGRPPC